MPLTPFNLFTTIKAVDPPTPVASSRQSRPTHWLLFFRGLHGLGICDRSTFETDVLFGKRSEVKDSHEVYANIGVIPFHENNETDTSPQTQTK
jgi:hypothetical protein